MTKSQEQSISNFYYSITDHIESLKITEVIEKKTGKKKLAFSVTRPGPTKDTFVLYPIGILFDQEESPFDLYDFNEEGNEPSVVYETAKPWWRFWK